MPVQFVDVGTLPFEQSYTCKNGSVINMQELLEGLRTPINVLGTTGNIGQIDSLGFAMAEPMWYTNYDLTECWNDYARYVWFVGGWGPDRNMFIANAVRKMRPMLREQTDTLMMRHDRNAHSFMNPVGQVDADAKFPWGDFPWGGAVSLFIGGMFFEGAVSCFDDDIDDHNVASLTLGTIGKQIVRGNGLLPLED